MQLKMLVVVIALAVVFGVAAPKAFASNLLINGSFETGDFTGWSLMNCGQPLCQVVSGAFYRYTGAENGNDYAVLGPVGVGTLSESFSDIVGAQYTFSFWFAGAGDFHSFFAAYWDSTQLLTLSSADTGGSWTQFSFTETGTGSDSISFQFVDFIQFEALDNASVSGVVTPTPEPSSLILLATGVLGLDGVVRRKLRG
jgi:hypothetical protein